MRLSRGTQRRLYLCSGRKMGERADSRDTTKEDVGQIREEEESLARHRTPIEAHREAKRDSDQKSVARSGFSFLLETEMLQAWRGEGEKSLLLTCPQKSRSLSETG